MRKHDLKILNDFADEIVIGNKTFEIRKNDRGFQKGAFVKFQAVDETGFENQHLINDKLYEIVFVINGWGIKNGYVVFSIRENKNEKCVATNMGKIPINDYLEIKASQAGFECYEDMKEVGYKLDFPILDDSNT